MLEGGLRRTIAVTMAPVAPLRAVRRAEHDRTSGVADAELRNRHGFAVTARATHATVEGLSDVLSHLLPYNNVEERGLFLPLLSLLGLPATIDGD
jgi:hypothetical protein